MNGKKAKAIRRLAKAHGQYKTEPELKGMETKKVVYVTGPKGEPQAQQVSRFTVINLSKIGYRRLKQAYKNGELAI